MRPWSTDTWQLRHVTSGNHCINALISIPISSEMAGGIEQCYNRIPKNFTLCNMWQRHRILKSPLDFKHYMEAVCEWNTFHCCRCREHSGSFCLQECEKFLSGSFQQTLNRNNLVHTSRGQWAGTVLHASAGIRDHIVWVSLISTPFPVQNADVQIHHEQLAGAATAPVCTLSCAYAGSGASALA